MNITIVGTGYVGLVTGCCLAERGHNIVCIDTDKQKIKKLRKSQSPIYEPGLEELLNRNIKRNRITFSTELAEGVIQADAVFLALPTPPQKDGSANILAVLSVAEQLGRLLPDKYCVVINKSTVPVGTAELVRQAIAKNKSDNFGVVSNPEFLREGHAINDFMEPERVVVGVPNEKAEARMREIYLSFIDEHRPFLVTDPVTAELTKYAANTYLVTKISFMNEMAQLCERMGADVDMVRQAIGADSRIGSKFLYPGIGSGGSCFPKDVRALHYMSETYGYNFRLLKAAIDVNNTQPFTMVTKVEDYFEDLKGKTIGLWGLAFKPFTDDIRESPALVIADALINVGASIVAYDPEAGDNVRALYSNKPNFIIVDDKYAAIEGADCLLIATEWPEFIEADLSKVRQKLTHPVVFDGRNIYEPQIMKKAGFTYISVGRKPISQDP